jgi:hypothetical protein
MNTIKRGRGNRPHGALGQVAVALLAAVPALAFLFGAGCASAPSPAPVVTSVAQAPAFETIASKAVTLEACRQRDRACHFFSTAVLDLGVASGAICFPSDASLEDVEAVIVSALIRDTSDEPAQAAARALSSRWPCPAVRYEPATVLSTAKVTR